MATVDYVHDLAFPKLSVSEVEWLAGLATICSFKDGELVFQAGQRGVPFYVVESGEIAIVDESTDESKTIVVHGPREFTGDVSLLTDRPAAISAYAKGDTRAYCVTQGELRRVLQEIPDLSDKLLEAFQTRRIMLERSGFVGIRVFGHLDDPALTEIREFFDKNNQPRPEAVVLGRPPEGAVYVRLPPLGAWSWSGPGFSQAPTEASPLMTNSRLIQCHARVLPNPDQNGKSTPDRSKLFGSHGQRPWF